MTDAVDTSGIGQESGNPAVSGVWTGTPTNGTPSAGIVVDQVQFLTQNGDILGTSQFMVDNLQVIPEPATFALLGVSMLFILVRRRA